MIKIAHNPRATPRPSTASVIPTRPSRSTAAPLDANVREWMTECWKHRVEAEARNRLLRNIRGVATSR
jgi:hypothetical protein